MVDKTQHASVGKDKKGLGWIWVLVLGLLCSGIYYQRISKQTPPESIKAVEKKGKGLAVVVAVATTVKDVPVYLNGLGTVTGLNTVTVKSRIDGELVRVVFKEGQQVAAGDLLAEIDARALQVQLSQAEAQLQRDEALLKNAEIDWSRYKTLLAQDSISAQETATQAALVKQYQGTVAVDRAAISNAKLQLSYTRITAPISGRVGLRLVDAGNMVHSNDANGLVVITQVQPIAVVFTLPEAALPAVMQKLNRDKPLKVIAYDRSGQQPLAEGHLLAVDNQIDLNTGTVKLKSQFANTDASLFANQFVNVALLIDTLHAVVTAPTASIQQGVSGAFVYVVKDDKTVALRLVKLGPVTGEQVVIEQGLQADELVVVEGVDKLRDGAPIKLIARETAPAQPHSS